MITPIFTVEKFLEFVDGLSSEDNSLFAFSARDHAYKIREGIEDGSDAIRWFNSIVRGHHLSGQTIDYTKGNPQFDHKDHPVSICPICNRLGKVYTDPKYPFFTEHVVKIISGMMSTVLDECKWGNKWYNDRWDDFNECSRENYLEGVNVVTESEDGLVKSRTVTRKRDIHYSHGR